MELLKDKFGRKFPYIRLSITDVCNFKCGYCLPNGFKIDKSDNRTFLSLEEIKRLAKGLSELGVSKIRLTGGEPTIRKDFYDIVKVIKKSSKLLKKRGNLFLEIDNSQMLRTKEILLKNNFFTNVNLIQIWT